MSFFVNCLSTFYQLLSTFINFLSTALSTVYQLFINFINLLSTVYQLYQLLNNCLSAVFHSHRIDECALFVLSAWPLRVQLLVLPDAEPHLPQRLLQPPRTMVASGRTNSAFVQIAGLMQRLVTIAGSQLNGLLAGGGDA